MRTVVFIVCIAFVLVACGGDESDAVQEPSAVMSAVADTIGSASSLRFQITLDGPGVELDEGITLVQLDGAYQAPDSATTDARVRVLGLTASIDIITIGDRAWQKAPLETEFTELGTGQAPFSASELFAPDGIPAILRDDLTGLERSPEEAGEIEAFPGESYDLIVGTITGTRIDELTSGLVQADGAGVAVFVNGDEVRRIVITEPGEGRNVWTIDAWAYDDPVSVVPPPGFE